MNGSRIDFLVPLQSKLKLSLCKFHDPELHTKTFIRLGSQASPLKWRTGLTSLLNGKFGNGIFRKKNFWTKI
jgi:hypothetical protein